MKKKPEVPQEITDLREKILKYHKNGKLGENLIMILHEESKLSAPLISLFKDGKRWLSMESFFKLKDVVEGLEKVHGVTE